MPEARLREWFAALPHEELVDMFVSYVRTFLRERDPDLADTGFGALGDLSSLTFAQLIDELKATLRHPELSRLRVEGERVAYVLDSGIEVTINATGEREAAPAPSTSEPPTERPPDAHMIDPPEPQRPEPVRRRGGVFGETAPTPAPVRKAKGDDSSDGDEGKSPLLEF